MYLSAKEKDDLLVSVASEPGERWKVALLRSIQQQEKRRTSPAIATIQRRTVGDLLAAAHTSAEQRAKLVETQRAAEAARRKAEDEANRAWYLAQLAGREGEIWNQVAAHILKRQPNEYDKAVTLLTDLHELAVRQGQTATFQSAVEKLRRKHAAKESFLRRLAKANL